jgi:hypothetical protein
MIFNFRKPLIEERFPNNSKANITPSTVKIGISRNHISTDHILSLFSAPILENRTHLLDKGLPIIQSEIQALSKYNLENVNQLRIISKYRVVFLFYLIYDLHLKNPQIVDIDLDQYKEPSSWYGSLMKTLASLSGISSSGIFFMSRIFM